MTQALVSLLQDPELNLTRTLTRDSVTGNPGIGAESKKLDAEVAAPVSV
jgi:hypothetical protein